ncbi:Short-chain dehydrogenase [Frankia canadensis]|uniref:Short-chain dehydrogenase n=1 Tax=Frankia canadensis TaxID=1836972 RepID=A0A2I2KI49_9ACTN|nr:SDR family oxidoreductase [Frankia canadensis]SNQ45309.1 Short-chain dehydrogenase [Frankia canadensis]SOU52599.1 Short-chain dehydrogenase [Frankia canadensis]
MSKVWFVTGSSRGFGRVFVESALQAGHQVAATARNVDTLADLSATYGDAVLALPLDVTDKSAVDSAVKAAVARFGRLDVVVNNAGYGLFGAVEELSESQIRDQLETNFFGALWVTQAVLPQLREQREGHIIQISTIGGIAAFPNLGGYHASKWALEGLSEALAQEVAAFGIKVTLVEPGGFSTDWAGSSAVRTVPNPAYDSMRQVMAERSKAGSSSAGDPAAAGPALMKIVEAENPPLRVLFGAPPTQLVKYLYQQRLNTWAQWEDVSIQAQGG